MKKEKIGKEINIRDKSKRRTLLITELIEEAITTTPVLTIQFLTATTIAQTIPILTSVSA